MFPASVTCFSAVHCRPHLLYQLALRQRRLSVQLQQPQIKRGDTATAFPFLESVIKTGGHDWQEICRKVDECHCQVWLAVTDKPIAALVTQMTTDDVLECLIAGGTNAKQWAWVAEQHLAAFAARNGSQRLRIWGRRGWHRIFPHWQVMGEEDGLLIMEYAL